MRQVWRALVVTFATSLSTISVCAASPADEGFRTLSGAEIRKTFVGKMFTDVSHFSNRYMASGTIEGVSRGARASST